MSSDQPDRERFVEPLQARGQLFILGDRRRHRNEPEIHDREAERRAHQPADDRLRDEEQIHRDVHGAGRDLLPGGHVNRRRRGA